MRSNRLKYYINLAAYSVASNAIGSFVLQSFLFEAGANDKTVSLFMSAITAIQTMAMLGISNWVEKSKNIARTYVYVILLQLIFSLTLTVSCVSSGHAAAMLPIVYILGIVNSVFQGTQIVLQYKIPYYEYKGLWLYIGNSRSFFRCGRYGIFGYAHILYKAV